jgi:hypothetical protein
MSRDKFGTAKKSVTKLRDRAINTLSSYTGSPEFKTQTGYWLSRQLAFMVFLIHYQ